MKKDFTKSQRTISNVGKGKKGKKSGERDKKDQIRLQLEENIET